MIKSKSMPKESMTQEMYRQTASLIRNQKEYQQVDHYLRVSLEKERDNKHQNKIGFYQIYPENQMEKNKKLKKMQDNLIRAQETEKAIINNVDNSARTQKSRPKIQRRMSFFPNLQQVNNFKSIHNPKDVQCMHREEKIFQDEELSYFDQKLIKKIRINKSVKNLDEIYRQFDRTQLEEGLDEQKKELKYTMCLDQQIKKEDQNEVLNLNQWEDKFFNNKQEQKYILSITEKDMNLNKLNNVSLINRVKSHDEDILQSQDSQNNEDRSQENTQMMDKSSQQILAGSKPQIIDRKRSFIESQDLLCLQQDLDADIEKEIEEYDNRYRKIKDSKLNAVKETKQIEKLNSNLLGLYNKYLHFLNIKCMKHSQMVSNFNKENTNIQSILKILVDFIEKLKLLVKDSDKGGWSGLKSALSPMKRNRLSQLDPNNSSNYKRMSSHGQSPNARLLSLFQTNMGNTHSKKKSLSLNKHLDSDQMLKIAIQQQDKHEKMIQKERDIEQFKKKLNYNKQIIRMQNIEIILLKDKIKIYERKRTEFLKSILKRGEDCREGIHWVVFSLIKKNQALEEDMFPKWLDEKAQKFIMQRFHMEHQLKQMKEIQLFILNLYKDNKQTQKINKQVQQNMAQKQKQIQKNLLNSIHIDEHSQHDILGKNDGSYDSQFENRNTSSLSQSSNKQLLNVLSQNKNQTSTTLQVYKHVRSQTMKTKQSVQQMASTQQKIDKQYELAKQTIY